MLNNMYMIPIISIPESEILVYIWILEEMFFKLLSDTEP